MDTANEMYGRDPHDASVALAGPGTVAGTPAVASGLRGVQGMHPAHSPTPWVIGMFVVLALLLHPKGGFNAGGKVSLG